MQLEGFQDCTGRLCKNDLPSEIAIIFSSPAMRADKLEETLSGLDKVFSLALISQVIVKGPHETDEPKYHPVSVAYAPQAAELLAPLARTSLEFEERKNADHKNHDLIAILKSVEKPLLENLLKAFERKRQKLDFQNFAVAHKDPEFYFDQALVRMQLKEPVDEQLANLQKIVTGVKSSPEAKVSSTLNAGNDCKSRRAKFLSKVLTSLSDPSPLQKDEAIQLARNIQKNIPDDPYRLQALYELALKSKQSDLPGLSDSDSEKDILHSTVMLVLLAALSLISPIFVVILTQQLLLRQTPESNMQALSAVTYGWRRMLIVVTTLLLSLLLIVGFELSVGFASETEIALLALNHPIVRILCDLVGSTLYNLPVLVVYFLWCIPKGISFTEGFGLRACTVGYSFKKLCSMGIVAYLALNSVTVATMALMLFYHHPDSVTDASSGVATGISPGAAALLFFVESLFGPLLEELCFRGVLYRGLRASWGIVPSLIVSSLWFAILHNEFAPWLLFHKFAVGAVNALLYEKTKSLVPSVVAHCLNNIFLNLA